MAANSSGNSNTPPVPTFTHPALHDWAVTQEVDKLEKSYERDQQHNPSARRLRQHAEAMEAVFDREIGRRRFVDTPQLCAAVRSERQSQSLGCQIACTRGACLLDKPLQGHPSPAA